MTAVDTSPRCVECNKVIPQWVIAESLLLGFKVEVCSARCSVALAARRQRQR